MFNKHNVCYIDFLLFFFDLSFHGLTAVFASVHDFASPSRDPNICPIVRLPLVDLKKGGVYGFKK